MRNRKVKIFALVLAGCLSLSGLTGCGGGIKMTTDDTSSKSDSGLICSIVVIIGRHLSVKETGLIAICFRLDILESVPVSVERQTV